MACLAWGEKIAIKIHRRLTTFTTIQKYLTDHGHKDCEPQNSIVNKIIHHYEHIRVHDQSGANCLEMLLLEWNSGWDKVCEENACFISVSVALITEMFWELLSSLVIPHHNEERGTVVRQVRNSQKNCLYVLSLHGPDGKGQCGSTPTKILRRKLVKVKPVLTVKIMKCPSKIKYWESSCLKLMCFPHYPCNAGNWGKQHKKKKDVLSNRSLKLINVQKVVWRWKALLLSVINSGVTPLLIINNNNATEHATCQDLKILLKYESLIYSDILNGKNKAWRDVTTCLSKALNTEVEESKTAIQISDLGFTGLTPADCSLAMQTPCSSAQPLTSWVT